MLEKHKNDESISIVTGNNFQAQQPMNISADYYYSIFPHIWGWATWKRTWVNYDFEILDWQKINQKKLLANFFDIPAFRNYWIHIFNKVANNEIDTWDFQFFFHCWQKNQMAVTPKANLVTNISCGIDATHTLDKYDSQSNMPTYELSFPLIHPLEKKRNSNADNYTQKRCFGEIKKYNKSEKFIKNIKRRLKFRTL